MMCIGEGHYDMFNILSGSRVEDRAREEAGNQ